MIIATASLSLLPVGLVLPKIVDEMVAGSDGDGGRITLLAAIMAAMYLSSALLGVAEGFVNQYVGQGVMYDVRAALHTHLQKLSVRFYTATPPAKSFRASRPM